ncbi:uncharacterized protein LOC101845372 [Aplysia californica]|uniref:Uncharacterized protein LOC101845372 n=1 Tax=Aplysia californica TaxID=6500 RepID=A0ABM0JBG6_APLCA|nr:uncharacterized protein LOC101845372 [Aplysia californica]
MSNTKRKENYSEQEIRTLIAEVRRNRDILFGALSSGVSVRTKAQAWFDITQKVNSIAECYRTPEELKKKWRKLAAQARSDLKERLQPSADGVSPKREGKYTVVVLHILGLDDVKITTTDVEETNHNSDSIDSSMNDRLELNDSQCDAMDIDHLGLLIQASTGNSSLSSAESTSLPDTRTPGRTSRKRKPFEEESMKALWRKYLKTTTEAAEYKIQREKLKIKVLEKQLERLEKM